MELQIKPNGQAVTTVPKAMRNAKGWKDSQELEWKLNDKGNLEQGKTRTTGGAIR